MTAPYVERRREACDCPACRQMILDYDDPPAWWSEPLVPVRPVEDLVVSEDVL